MEIKENEVPGHTTRPLKLPPFRTLLINPTNPKGELHGIPGRACRRGFHGRESSPLEAIRELG